eukprot:COSAG01_NODE_12637_length_1707_cov_2.674751_1_plen_481_part_01
MGQGTTSRVTQQKLLLLLLCGVPTTLVSALSNVAWGYSSDGGSIPAATQTALDAAPGVSHIASTWAAFVVRTSAGQWYAWGDSGTGGSIPAATQSALDAAPGVSHIASTDAAYVVRTSPCNHNSAMCIAGCFSPNSTSSCKECAAGSVTDTLAQPGGTSCTACIAGSFSPSPEVACRVCAAGSVTNTLAQPGGTSCTACAAGRFSPNSTVPCTQCIPGKISASGGAQACAPCPDGSMSAVNETTFCTRCPYSDRCIGGVCALGTTGRGCASCALEPARYYQAGQQCVGCFGSIWLVSAVTVVACVVLLYMLWHVTRTQHVDQEEPAGAVATAETAAEVAQAMSRVSNAAILASIALTHLQFSMFVWELPFDLPPVLGSIAAWAASVFSFDIGQLSSPECQSSSTDPKTVFVGKLALLHVAYLATNCLLRMVPKVIGHRHRLHAVNAMTALYTIVVTALVKCCLRAVDCTWQPALDRYTLDA